MVLKTKPAYMLESEIKKVKLLENSDIYINFIYELGSCRCSILRSSQLTHI